MIHKNGDFEDTKLNGLDKSEKREVVWIIIITIILEWGVSLARDSKFFSRNNFIILHKQQCYTGFFSRSLESSTMLCVLYKIIIEFSYYPIHERNIYFYLLVLPIDSLSTITTFTLLLYKTSVSLRASFSDNLIYMYI